MNPQQFEEDFQRTQAAMGAGFTVLVTHTDANGQPQHQRVPVTLEHFAKLPKLWSTWLRDAMLRSGKGYRKPVTRNVPPKGAAKWRGERRLDKIAMAERAARNPVFTGKLNYRRSEAP
jgi:putative SOS response-associated peptidase YedK